MKTLRRIGLGFLVFVSLLSIGTHIFPQQVSAVPADIMALDREKRTFFQLAQCLGNNGSGRGDRVIDTGRDLSNFEDIVGGKMDREEVVVGLDMDSSNGVISCANAIRMGINLLFGENTIGGGSSVVANVGRWLTTYLTGQTNFNNGTISRDAAGWKTKIDALIGMANAEYSIRQISVAPYADAILQQRVIGLVDICYAKSANAANADYTFSVEGVGYFTLRGANGDGNIKDRLEHAVEVRKSDSRAYLGDVYLEWTYGDGIGGATFHTDSSDIYPLGNDIELARGSIRDAIVDCNFIKNNKDIILAGLKIDDNGNFISTDGSPLSPELQESIGSFAPGGVEEDRNTCESKGGVLGWILCPVILAMDSAMSWLDTQIQSLLAIDENKANDPGLKQAWQSIRNIAYIVLIPIMLVMVIGTALGIEVMSAYTVRKALPRMAIAIIFITLSWYITNFLITFFNVVGGGILGLLTNPFSFNGEPVGTLSLGDLFSAKFGGGFWQTVSANVELGLSIVVVAWLFLAPLALIILTAFVVLFLRQLFIVALSLLAPLAILAWIFPGNDKLWKMWWSAFSKLLIMFPLIMVIIAVGRIFAAILAGPFNDGGVDNWFLTPLFVLAAYVLPYAAIPLTFKAAGGIFANITGMMQGGEKGMFAKMRERRGQKIGSALKKPKSAIADARYSGARGAVKWGEKGGRLRGFVGRRVANRVGGGRDWEAENSARNAEAAKMVDAEKSSGNDAQIRGATVNLKALMEAKEAFDKAKKSGDKDAIAKARLALEKHAVLEGDTIKSAKTLGGGTVSLNDAILGHRRFNDRASQQAALTYELTKARNTADVERVMANYDSLATEQWGMSQDRADEAWIGAAFGTQGQHLELKKAKRDKTTGERKVDAKGFVQEVFDTKGSYPAAQMDAHFMQSLDEAYEQALKTNDADLKGQVEAIVDTFSVRGIGGVQNVGDDGKPIERAQAAGSDGVSSAGSAAFDEKLQALHKKVKANRPSPPSTP